MRRRMRLRTVDVRVVILTTAAAMAARALRSPGRIMRAHSNTTPRGSGRAMLRLRVRAGAIAMDARAAILPRQGYFDQPLDVAQISHFIGPRDQRNGNPIGAGAR